MACTADSAVLPDVDTAAMTGEGMERTTGVADEREKKKKKKRTGSPMDGCVPWLLLLAFACLQTAVYCQRCRGHIARRYF